MLWKILNINSNIIIMKLKWNKEDGAGEMTWWVKAQAAKPDNSSAILMTYMGEGEHYPK